MSGVIVFCITVLASDRRGVTILASFFFSAVGIEFAPEAAGKLTLLHLSQCDFVLLSFRTFSNTLLSTC